MVKGRVQSQFINALIRCFGIKNIGQILKNSFISASGFLVMLRDKYPAIYEDQDLLNTYCRRIIYNYGIDIGMF